MSDRLALANAFEDAGIERSKAERVASVIFDVIHDNVATKADLAEVRHEIEQLGTSLRGEMAQLGMSLRGEIASVRGEMALLEHRLLTRLGGLVVVVAGLLLAALHYWPPAAHG
jgi:hypothetical protein